MRQCKFKILLWWDIYFTILAGGEFRKSAPGEVRTKDSDYPARPTRTRCSVWTEGNVNNNVFCLSKSTDKMLIIDNRADESLQLCFRDQGRVTGW